MLLKRPFDLILCVQGSLGVQVVFRTREKAETDGSSHYNELHRKWLRFAKFVFAACFQAFIGQCIFTKCCSHS
jgi:hypothetical protein